MKQYGLQCNSNTLYGSLGLSHCLQFCIFNSGEVATGWVLWTAASHDRSTDGSERLVYWYAVLNCFKHNSTKWSAFNPSWKFCN